MMIGGGHPRARLTRHPPQVKRFMHSWEPSGGLGGDKSKGTAAAGGKRTAMASAAAASSADARSSALQARPAIAHLRALPVCAAQSTSSAAPRLLARGVPPQIGANGWAANGRRGRGVRGQARVWPCYVRGPKVEPFRSYFQECFELDSAIVRFAQTGEGATARLYSSSSVECVPRVSRGISLPFALGSSWGRRGWEGGGGIAYMVCTGNVGTCDALQRPHGRRRLNLGSTKTFSLRP